MVKDVLTSGGFNFMLFVGSCCFGALAELTRDNFDNTKKPLKVYHLVLYLLGFCYLPFILIPRTKVFRTLVRFLNTEVGGRYKN